MLGGGALLLIACIPSNMFIVSARMQSARILRTDTINTFGESVFVVVVACAVYVFVCQGVNVFFYINIYNILICTYMVMNLLCSVT